MASCIETDWSILKALESTKIDLLPPLKVEVQTLRLKVFYLRTILVFTGELHIEDGNLKTLLTRVRSVFCNANVEFARLGSELLANLSKRFWSMPMNFDGQISCMLQRLDHSKPEIQQLYTILSTSSRSITGLTYRGLGSVVEFLEQLVESMEDLLSCKADLVVPVREELDTVEKGLRFLRNFLCFTANGRSMHGKLKDLLIHAHVVADNTACLLYLCSVNNKMDDQMINWMKLELLSLIQKIRPQRPEVRNIYVYALKTSKSARGDTPPLDKFASDFLDSLLENILELSECKLSFMISAKDQMLALHEQLSVLKSYVMDPLWKEHTGNLPDIVTLIKAINTLIYEAGFLICNDVKDVTTDINSAFSDLLAKVEDTKQSARNLYDSIFPKSSRVNFPKTYTRGFTSFLLENLKEFLKSEAELVAPWKHHIEAVRKEIQSLREDFSIVEKHHWEHEELKDLWSSFKDVAYWTEYIVDSAVAGYRPIWLIKLSLFNIIEEIKMIKTELKHINAKMTKTDSPKDIVMLSSKEVGVLKKMPTSDIKLVGFDDEAEKTKEQLIYSSKNLEILSIVGMPGIGKTTLADSVFQHYSIIKHFHIRARCCVSQHFDKKRVLLEILQEVTGETHQYSDDLDHKLYKSLKGRRYLIFLDDIWGFEPWDQLKHSFPDDGNGSRIMLTSRFTRIASQAEPRSFVYELSPLSTAKSWEMLRIKLFGEDRYPLELEEVGQEIATNCKGLPLTIGLIAGVLRVTEKEEDCWRTVAASFMSQVVEDPQGQCRMALELSYHHLPDHLKPCFLYVGAFPEDQAIHTRKLISLWIAEGLVRLQENDRRSLEDEAEVYLNDLIDRNFTIVSARGPLGQVKATRVHDLLHEFALAKSKEEGFLLPINRSDASPTSSSNCYRLCIYPGYWDHFCENIDYGRRVRSLICSSMRSRRGYSFGHTSSVYKLLRVLDLANVCMHQCCPSIFGMVHLRFLALYVKEFTTSGIHVLRNLETLLLYAGSLGGVSLSLEHLSGMVKLRHLHLRDVDLLYGEKYMRSQLWLRNPNREFFERFHLDNLQSISRITMTPGEDAEKIMRQMPNLRKLKCRFMMDDTGNCKLFPKLNFLEKLESLDLDLYCFGRGRRTDLGCYGIKLYFPPNLKKLTLEQFRLPWTEISLLGNMERLEVLKLKKDAFVGQSWNMIEGQFPRLKYLVLSELDIEEWNASEDDLPCLERLHLSCSLLKKLPPCLEDSTTIQEITVGPDFSRGNIVSSPSLISSTMEIKSAQEAYGNDHFVVNELKYVPAIRRVD